MLGRGREADVAQLAPRSLDHFGARGAMFGEAKSAPSRLLPTTLVPFRRPSEVSIDNRGPVYVTRQVPAPTSQTQLMSRIRSRYAFLPTAQAPGGAG